MMFKTRKGPGESQFCRQTVPSINPPNKRSANVRLTVPHEIFMGPLKKIMLRNLRCKGEKVTHSVTQCDKGMRG